MTKLETIAIDWLNKNYSPMEPFYMEKYPDYLFHMKNGRCILQHNKNSGYVYVSYIEIWSFFESYFSMSNQQIKDITKIWVEEHYKMEVTTDKYIILDELVEEHYKKSEITTEKGFTLFLKVEEQYKDIQTTNNQNEFYFNRDVEELYNQHTNG